MSITVWMHVSPRGVSPQCAGRTAPRGAAFFVFCLLFAASFAGCAGSSLRRAPEIPHTVSFNTHAYKRFSLKELRGKVVLFFFWSGSHVACRNAVSDINRFYEMHRGDGLEVIGVHAPNWASFEGSQQYVFESLQACGIKFPVIMDEGGRIKAAYGYLVVPSVCLVDRNGFIRAQYGGVLDFSQIKVALDELLTQDGRPAPERMYAPLPKTKRFQGFL